MKSVWKGRIQHIKKKIEDKDVMFLYIASGVVLAGALVLLGWFLFKPTSSLREIDVQKNNADAQENEACEIRRYYNGVCEDSNTYEKRLVGVMIENHTEARPQSGLADAVIVYEAPVEANYTRFLALYPLNTDVEKIGPVRSARPYYLDWLAEFGKPMYMHVGGSPEALNLIAQRKLFDVNEFSRGWYFWRSKDRYAPHNTYTSGELFRAAWDEYGEVFDEEFTTSSWQYSDEIICDISCVREIEIEFALPSYVARWKYNTSTEQFERYQIEGKHKDQNGTPIVADTVIVQHVSSDVIDNIGRKRIGTVGIGKAVVFAKGKMTVGRWEKPSHVSKTQWLDDEGNPIELAPGTIWIEVVGQDSEFSYSMFE